MSQIINKVKLEEEYTGAIDVLCEVVNLAKAEVPGRLQKMQKAINQYDTREVRLQSQVLSEVFKLLFANEIVLLMTRLHRFKGPEDHAMAKTTLQQAKGRVGSFFKEIERYLDMQNDIAI
jgi:hypothetical protein